MSHGPARGISIGLCKCPHIHILITDEDGQVLAAYTCKPDQSLKIAADIEGMANEALGKNGFRCEGHA